MSRVKWKELALLDPGTDQNQMDQSMSSKHLSQQTKLSKTSQKEDSLLLKTIKLENQEFITFENLVRGSRGGLHVRVTRKAPNELEESKKSKMKPSQLVNFDEQVFEGQLVFEEIEQRLNSVFIKDTPKKNRFEFIKKIQRTFEIRQNSSKLGLFTQIENSIKKNHFFSDSFKRGLCFRVPLEHRRAADTPQIFNCERMYLKLYIRSDNFELFGKNIFNKYNMNKIIKIISPIKKLPEQSMEDLFQEYLKAFFEPFRAKLQEYGRRKQWVKETFLGDSFDKENLPSASEQTKSDTMAEFFLEMTKNNWMLDEFRQMSAYV